MRAYLEALIQGKTVPLPIAKKCNLHIGTRSSEDTSNMLAKDKLMALDHWSDKEKKIARRAFDAAVQRERAALLEEFKQKAAGAKDFDDLWQIEDYLKKKRRELDAKYDYRYSQLRFVFTILLAEGRVTEEDLAGLSEEKLAAIRALRDDKYEW